MGFGREPSVNAVDGAGVREAHEAWGNFEGISIEWMRLTSLTMSQTSCVLSPFDPPLRLHQPI